MKGNQITGGVVLIVLGAFFLLTEFFPKIAQQIFGGSFSWPWIIIGIGIIFLVSAVVARNGELAVPACVIGGIGFILNYQNQTGDWASWAYAWTLIPGLGGLGTLLGSLLGGKLDWRDGVRAILVSAVLFLIFASAFGGLDREIAQYWPVILIVIGLWMIVRNMLGSRTEPE